MAKVAGQAVLSEEGAKALSEGLWERMGSMGFELFHHNRASLYSAAQVFDLVSFVLVFMALMSIVPEQSITHNTSWMTGKVSNGPWLFPDDSSSVRPRVPALVAHAPSCSLGVRELRLVARWQRALFFFAYRSQSHA